MKVFLVLLVATYASAQVLLPFGTPLTYAVPSVPDAFPASQYHGQGEAGQFSFGHSSVQQSRSEVRLPSGQVLGHYSYIDPNGEPAVTYYEAGPETGYRVVGSNVLPEAPQAELKLPVDEGVAPEPVQDTPEVVQARAEFAANFEKTQTRSKRNVLLPNLFTDLEKVTDDDQVTLYSRNEPNFAYAFTNKPHPLPTLKTSVGVPLVYSTFPFFSVPAKPAEDKVSSRRRRSTAVPLPYLHVVPTTSSATFRTSQFEQVDANTPADTTKLDLVTKEHKVQFPSYSFVQPTVQAKPVTYTAVTSPFVNYPLVNYPFVHTPFVSVKSE